jgi:hypothetical protein
MEDSAVNGLVSISVPLPLHASVPLPVSLCLKPAAHGTRLPADDDLTRAINAQTRVPAVEQDGPT